MPRRIHLCFMAITLVAIVGLVSTSKDADACGGRFRLFSGRSFSAQQCVPLETLPVVVEPAKESPLPAVSKDMRVNVKNIAAFMKKGDNNAAKKLAAATAKAAKLIDDIGDLMEVFRPINKGGLGIEISLKKPSVKDAEELGYLITAMAELMVTKSWGSKGKMTKNAWRDYTQEMRESGVELAKASNIQAVKTAAEKVNAACNRCHAVFK